MTIDQNGEALSEWTIEPGDLVTRSVVAERYGGSTQGESSRRAAPRMP